MLIKPIATCIKQCHTSMNVEPCCLASSCRPPQRPPNPPAGLAWPWLPTLCCQSCTACCVVQTSTDSLLTSFQPAVPMAPHYLASYNQGLEQLQRQHQALQSPPGVALRRLALHLLSTVLPGEENHA